MRMTHKQKVKLARKMAPGLTSSGLFDTDAWYMRSFNIAQRVQRKNEEAAARKVKNAKRLVYN